MNQNLSYRVFLYSAVARSNMRNFWGTSLLPATTNAGHGHGLGTYTFRPIPHSVGLVVSLNKRSTGIPRVERSISITCVCDLLHSAVSRSTSPLDRDECVETGGTRRASIAVRQGRQRGCRCYDSVRLSKTTARVPVSLILLRVLRQPGHRLQNALPTTIPSQSTPAELTPTALTVPVSLPISSLPARPNLPVDHVVSYNGFATVDSERAFLHLLKKANVDANWAWDQTMHAIIMDPLYKALSTLAEKWQKVIAPSHPPFWSRIQ